MSALALLPFLLTFYPLLIMWTSYVTMLWWLKAGNYMGLILFPLPHLYVNFTSSSLTVLLLSGFQSGIPHGVLLKYFLGLLRSVTTSCFFFFSFWCGPFLKSLLSLLTVSLLFYVLVFWPWGMWQHSSPTRDRTCTPCIERWSLSHWTTWEVPIWCF